MPPVRSTSSPHRPAPACSELYLCQCWDCESHETITPGTIANLVRGRYLPYAQHLKHQLSLKQSGLAACWQQAINHSCGMLEHTACPEVKDLQPRHVRRANKPQAHFNEELEAYYSQLRSFQTRVEQISDVALSVCPVFKAAVAPSSCLVLDPLAPENSAILEYEAWLPQVKHFVQHHPLRRKTHKLSLRSTVVLRAIERSSIDIDSWKRRWMERERQRESVQDKLNNVIDTSALLSPQLAWNPILLITFLLAASLHLLSGLSMSKVGDVLKGVRSIVKIAAAQGRDAEITRLATELPNDVRTVINALPCLTPPSKVYACCSDCYSIYHIDSKTGSTFPETCTYRATPDAAVCNCPLRKGQVQQARVQEQRQRKQADTPEHEFLYQDFKHWLAWMFCRPDIAPYMEKFPISMDQQTDASMKDIWDGSILRDLEGPFGEERFMVRLPNERRLVFSFNFDSLNPSTTRPAGKVAKVGGMYMACLNLPRSIRFHPENIFFVGVVPGPGSPSEGEINHVLSPLVEDLLILWNEGIFLSRTPLHPQGVRIRCAMVPVVCDLPAAHQIVGASSYSSGKPCLQCDINLDDMHNLDYKNWPIYDGETMKTLGRQWRDAETKELQDKLFEMHHVRWSEFFRLPYWDPSQHVVVDSMHVFYLRLFQRHCRKVWGLDITAKDGPGLVFNPLSNPPSKGKMALGRHLLRTGPKTSLKGVGLGVLSQLCREVGLPHNPQLTVDVLCDSLLAHRIQVGWFDAKGKCLLSPQLEAPRLYKEASREIMRFHLKLDVAVEICKNILKLPLDNIVNADLGTLVNWIQEDRKRQHIINEKECLIALDPCDAALKALKKSVVLGEKTLSEVKNDMSQLLLPSCIGRGPHQPGEAAGGRLKADEWRTFCTVNLPITLTRLWSSEAATTHEQQMLENFLHLVQAVKIASFREISNGDIKAYEFHMHAYLTSLLSVYPGTMIRPNQHISLHFGEHLRRWGPVHSWRCFAFERFNGMIQKITTNSQFGELEGTLFRHFTQGQRLRALFQTAPQMPPELESFINSLSVQHDVEIRSTFMQDKLGFSNPSGTAHLRDASSKRKPLLDDSVYTLLKAHITQINSRISGSHIPRHYIPMQRVRRLDGVYRPLACSKKDCHIIFRDSQGRRPGQIRAILGHTRSRSDGSQVTETFLLVAPFVPLSDDHSLLDVFWRFPTSGRLFYNHFATELFIRIQNVVCHAALSKVEATSFGIAEDCVHVLPLDR